ncbi:hypothetical protein [Novosphingobium sp. TH158]|uniref:hypothetical protein n=1 Tax=Novosphingobium sp. TH158 TaxID=2067455 RepID=UPI000C7B069A|nr:hypothetical protein [Novosphingobium sp. TH158]PLK25710.1 hypothetical protein C0V78_01500 [Novosphingobium sp. TH158]
MLKSRKNLVRNLVLAMVVADAAGIYYLHSRLSQPTSGGASTIDDEMIAAAAKVDFKPQVQQPEAPALARELPKPAFGQEEAKLAAAPQPAPVAAKAAAVAKPVAAPALAAAPVVARPKAEAPRAALAARTIPAPRLQAPVAPSAKKVAAPSVVLASAKPKLAAPVRKRASFSKVFAGLAAPEVSVATASGSLASAAPAITAQFMPESREPVPTAMGITTQAMAMGQAGAPDTSLPKELGGSQPAVASTELPPSEGE